jgi:NosR/NirI family transcriptional regulator, nitrous oxide reductase regulator
MKVSKSLGRSMRGSWLPYLLRTFAIFVGLLWGSHVVSFGEQRFPPPEFESGYELPATQIPLPRSVAAQMVDVAVLVAALGVACFLVFKKRSRRGVIALSVFSLLYFGFYRKGCVCSIGSLQNVALGLANSAYAVPIVVTAFFVLPLAVALFAGRAFCAGVCPHGALQDLLLLKPLQVPAWLEQGLSVVPFLYLGAGVWFAASGSAFIICEYDPFVPIFRLSGSFFILSVAAVFLVASLFIGRPYCRFLCPYGALLKMASSVSKWRIRVTPDVCTQCRLCEDSCPHGALREPVVVSGRGTASVGGWKLSWIVLPVVILLAAWAGSRLGMVAAGVNPTVRLADQFLLTTGERADIRGANRTAESLALRRVGENPAEVLQAAADIRGRFVSGGWFFGAWVALVLGVKWLLVGSVPKRTDYEPANGSCFACARCFEFCPNELLRRGVSPAVSAAPQEGSLFEGARRIPEKGDRSTACRP